MENEEILRQSLREEHNKNSILATEKDILLQERIIESQKDQMVLREREIELRKQENEKEILLQERMIESQKDQMVLREREIELRKEENESRKIIEEKRLAQDLDLNKSKEITAAKDFKLSIYQLAVNIACERSRVSIENKRLNPSSTEIISNPDIVLALREALEFINSDPSIG